MKYLLISIILLSVSCKPKLNEDDLLRIEIGKNLYKLAIHDYFNDNHIYINFIKIDSLYDELHKEWLGELL